MGVRKDWPAVVTAYDVAKAAGVSVATVSRALRNSPRVAEASRRRIQAIAAEMNYRPNLVARSLRRRSTCTIGVVVDDISDEITSQIIRGVESECRKAGYRLLVTSTQGDPAGERLAVDICRDSRVDGVVIVDSLLRSASEAPVQGMAAVYVNRRHASGGTFHVGPDEFYGAHAAVAHLLALGHRRIGYVSGPGNWLCSPERLRGVQAALEEGGVHFDPEMVEHGDWSTDSGEAAAARMLSRSPRPTAIFAANDYMALGVVDAARARGLSVPRDLSVIGYDNRSFAPFVRPRLTTVSLPLYEMGQEAARLLLRLLKGSDGDLPPLDVVVRGRLFVRESTQASPS